jgi:hypothetical protein
MRCLRIAVVLVAGCGQLPADHYDGRYSGITKEDRCKPASSITALVYKRTFQLYVYSYQIDGTVDADGYLKGQGQGGDRGVTFTGHIARPIFGDLFSGTVTDGRCNPYVELSPGSPR